jgi:hypothetical protein
MEVEKVLKTNSPADVVDALLSAYKEIESNYALGKWKASELDAGHFVEATRRLLEHQLFATHTPIGKDLPKFNDAEMRRYEQAKGDDSYRILIPRALLAIFAIRNKRGVGHLGALSPNEMDATYIVYSVKWVMAEIVRLSSGLSVEDTQALMDSIIERHLAVLWKHEGVTRILASGLTARDEVLVLLYDTNPQHEEILQAAVEYKHDANFRKILSRLHKDRLIEYGRGKPVMITPKGILAAEEIILENKAAT